MKKLAILFSMFALLVGCEQVGELDQIGQNNDIENQGGVHRSDLPETVYASLEEAGTRTYVENGTDIVWYQGDEISYFVGSNYNAKYVNRGLDGEAEAIFELTDEQGQVGNQMQLSHAIYPYQKDCTTSFFGTQHSSYCEVSVNYPAVQTFARHSFGKNANLMAAIGEDADDTHLHFRNACGYLVLQLYGKGVYIKNIKITANNTEEKISGAATLTLSRDAEPVTTMADGTSHEVTLDCSGYNAGSGVALSSTVENALGFWIVLPPVTFQDGFKVTMTDMQDRVYEVVTRKRVEISRNHVLPMAAIEFDTDDVVYYTLQEGHDSEPIAFGEDNTNAQPFDANILEHYYDEVNKRFVIRLDKQPTAINEKAFYCSYITYIDIPATVTSIGELAFASSSISDLTIPGSVEEIACSAFNSTSINSLTFLPSNSNTPLRIGEDTYFNDAGAFYYSTLNKVNLNRELISVDENGKESDPNSDAEGIFSYVGSEYDNLDIVLGEQVKEISKYMFVKRNMTKISIPATVNEVKECAFLFCGKLSTVVFEESDTPIEVCGQFNQATQLGGTFEQGPFYDSPLASITLNREILHVDDEGKPFEPGELLGSGWEEGIFANKFYDEGSINATVVIGNKVSTLLKYMFCGVRMSSVAIPDSVTEIKEGAFYDCRRLQYVYCYSTVPPTLGSDVFSSCDRLEYISVPNDYVEAYKSANKWSSYKDIIIPLYEEI